MELIELLKRLVLKKEFRGKCSICDVQSRKIMLVYRDWPS